MYKFTTRQLRIEEGGHKAHQEIQKHFPYGKAVRYRIYSDKVVVQSPELPVTTVPFDMVLVPEYKIDAELRFNLLACPTRKVNHKVISIVGTANLVRWLQEQGGKRGFQVLSWEKVIPHGLTQSMKGDEVRIHNKVEYQGLLRVVDQDLFNVVVGSKSSPSYGLGRAKYAGFGLLDVS